MSLQLSKLHNPPAIRIVKWRPVSIYSYHPLGLLVTTKSQKRKEKNRQQATRRESDAVSLGLH